MSDEHLAQGRTKMSGTVFSIPILVEKVGRPACYVPPLSTSRNVDSVNPAHVTLCCPLGTEQQTKMAPKPPRLQKVLMQGCSGEEHRAHR